MNPFKVKEYILIIAIFGILLFPCTNGFVEKLSRDTIHSTALIGNFDVVKFSKFSLNDYVNGEFQINFEKWWEENFYGREYFVRTYNQLRYMIFNLNGSWKISDSGILGKNKTIFHEYYIEDALQYEEVYDFSLYENQLKCENYVDDLEQVAGLLEKLGKHLIFYITPSKGHFQEEQIPLRYQLKAKDKKHMTIDGADYLVRELVKTNLNWYDARKDMIELENTGIPVFYKTGIHCTRPADQVITKQLCNILKRESGSFPLIELEELEESTTPYWRDQDVFTLLNIYKGKIDPLYYSFRIKKQEDDSQDNLTVLIQGGSFAESFSKDFTEMNLGKDCYRIFYKQALYVNDDYGKCQPIEEWSDLDLKHLMDMSDFVIIEMNDASVTNWSNGFVNYLKNYLEDKYVYS